MRRLPLQAMYSGKSKGRSLRPLSLAVLSLSKNDSTVDDANKLRKYESKLKLAFQLYSKNMPTTSYEDCKKILAMLTQEKCDIPSDIVCQIIDKRITSLLKSGSLNDIIQIVNPWLPAEELNPINPTVATIPQANSALKGSMMSKLLFARAIVPNIMDGAPKEDIVKQVVGAALASFETVDVLELTDEEATTLDASLVSLRAVSAVLHMDFSDENMQALESVQAAADKKLNKSIESSVGCAMEASPHYRGRMEMALKAKVHLLQHGPIA